MGAGVASVVAALLTIALLTRMYHHPPPATPHTTRLPQPTPHTHIHPADTPLVESPSVWAAYDLGIQGHPELRCADDVARVCAAEPADLMWVGVRVKASAALVDVCDATDGKVRRTLAAMLDLDADPPPDTMPPLPIFLTNPGTINHGFLDRYIPVHDLLESLPRSVVCLARVSPVFLFPPIFPDPLVDKWYFCGSGVGLQAWAYMCHDGVPFPALRPWSATTGAPTPEPIATAATRRMFYPVEDEDAFGGTGRYIYAAVLANVWVYGDVVMFKHCDRWHVVATRSLALNGEEIWPENIALRSGLTWSESASRDWFFRPLPPDHLAPLRVPKVALVHTLYGQHFFHFTIETLEKLVFLHDVLADDPDIKLVRAQMFLPDFVLALPFMTPDRFVDPPGLLFADRAIVLSYSSMVQKDMADVRRVAHVADMLLDALAPPPAPLPDKVFIMRHNHGRNFANEHVVLAHAAAAFADFDGSPPLCRNITVAPFSPGDHSVPGQLAAWQSMVAAVGLTGSHMVGIVFARPHQSVVELTMHPTDPTFYHLSHARRHAHYSISAEFAFHRPCLDNFRLPPHVVERVAWALNDIAAAERARTLARADGRAHSAHVATCPPAHTPK